MLLEYRCLVPGATPDSIVRKHYISQLIKVLKQMDANTTIKSCWLEQPQILLVMAAWRNLERRLDDFLLRVLHVQQFFVYGIYVTLNVFFNQGQNALELLYSVCDVIFEVVKHKGERNDFVDVELIGFIELFHV